MKEHHHEKLSLIQDMIALSQADGHVSFMEDHFILSIATKLGVSAQELQQLKENPVSFNPQEVEMDRITHFYRLLLLMGVDDEHHEEEIEFCKNTGLKMGLRPAAINEVIDRLLESENGMLPPDEIIRIFQAHHN
ncbi:MAG: TerB family tellurite resistance protein [Flavobacteriales bacterium]|nr:TerB family tellurite resistance protein [Flavobacteriales bacterium]